MTQKENFKRTAFFVHEAHQSRLIVKTLLQFCDFEVVSTTPEFIFKNIEQVSKIDLIVFDFVYDLRLLDYCLRLKTEEKTRHAPLVVIVANPEITQEELNKFPIDKTIRAPIDLKELEGFFREYFKKPSD